MHGVRPMKPSFALTLIIFAYLAPVHFWPHAVNTAVGAEPDTPPAAAQKQAAGKASQPRSPLFEALEIRASEDAARQIAGAAEAVHRDPGMAWDRERAFAGMENGCARGSWCWAACTAHNGNCFSGTANGSRPEGRLPSCRRASAVRRRSPPGAHCCRQPSARPPGRPFHQPNTPRRPNPETQ